MGPAPDFNEQPEISSRPFDKVLAKAKNWITFDRRYESNLGTPPIHATPMFLP